MADVLIMENKIHFKANYLNIGYISETKVKNKMNALF